MNDNILQLGNILGCIFQPLYFCLFIFYVKQIKNKRIFFIALSILDYVLIQRFVHFKLGVNADLLYAIMFYINLKLFYKKSRITDLITYIVSNVIMGIINIISYFIFGMNFIGLIFALIIPIIVIIFISNKLYLIDKFYNKYWNRKKHKVKIKSITVRGFSVCTTIIEFVVIHFWILYLLFN